MIKEMHVFDNRGKSVESSKIELTSDFNNVTYDEHFKRVFAIKRILAVVIKETIALYQDIEIDDIVPLIESTALNAGTKQNCSDDKITIGESYVMGEGTVKFDLLVRVGVPEYLIEMVGCSYTQVKLNLEMQRKPTPGYKLSYRGLYYASRLISEQLSKIDNSTNYDVLVPVYSIWITLVGKTTDAANKVLKYRLEDSNYNFASKDDSFVGRMNTVTDLLNIYFICIDNSILDSKSVSDDLEPIIEFVSLLFAGQFNDQRLKKHDIEFEGVIDKHGEELRDMANYYSEVERIVAEEKAEGRAEGEAKGFVKMALDFGKDRGFIIKYLIKNLNISESKAEEYYEMFTK